GGAQVAVEPELHVRRLGETFCDQLKVRVGHAVDGAWMRGDTCTGCREALLHVLAHDVLQQLDRLIRRILVDAETVTAAHGDGRVACRARHTHEREPAEELWHRLVWQATRPTPWAAVTVSASTR